VSSGFASFRAAGKLKTGGIPVGCSASESPAITRARLFPGFLRIGVPKPLLFPLRQARFFHESRVSFENPRLKSEVPIRRFSCLPKVPSLFRSVVELGSPYRAFSSRSDFLS